MADEPFRWWLGMPLTSSRIVNMHPEGVDPDASTFTLQKLYDAARCMPKPHPLAGLTIVYCADNMKDAARQFVEEYNKPPQLGAPIVAAVSEYLPPGHIIGMRGNDIVLIAGPEKEPEAATPETEK